MSDKALMNRATLELTQKIQAHFPLDIDQDVLRAWNGCNKEFLQGYLVEIFAKMPRRKKLFRFLGTVEIPVATDLFVAKEKFVLNISDEAKVKISYFDKTFQARFINEIGTTHDFSMLHFYNSLEQFKSDYDIIEEFGGECAVECSLYSMFFLMEQQGHGQGGVLLTGGYDNIFYIRDCVGVLWAISLLWDGNGWNVDANSIDNSRMKRGSQSRIFSSSLILIEV